MRGRENSGGFGVVEWHGHPARLEAALCYLMDEDNDKEDGGDAAPVAGPVKS